MAINNRLLNNGLNIKMADEQQMTRDEFTLNNNHQNGRSFNEIDQQETDYSNVNSLFTLFTFTIDIILIFDS